MTGCCEASAVIRRALHACDKSQQLGRPDPEQLCPRRTAASIGGIIGDQGDQTVTTLPHTFKRIRLNLARSKEFPQGSSRHGYEFVARSTQDHIDAALWKQHRDHCRVRRFWKGADEHGFLVHRPGGPSMGAGSSTTIRRRGRRRKRLSLRRACIPAGEYVSIRNEDGEMHTYQVAPSNPPPDRKIAASHSRLAAPTY